MALMTSTTEDGTSGEARWRRVSDFAEVSDGGYGWGSAAYLIDGAMPLGHPIQAWEDTMTYVCPDHPSYDSAEPDLWFTDVEAAAAAGFTPAPSA